MHRLAVSVPLCLAAGLVCGCRGGGPARHEVTGTVVYNNGPLDEGVIDFEPQDGQGSKEQATIQKGEYRIPREKGLFPGRYKVRVMAGDGASGSGGGIPGADKPRPGVSPGQERIPPDYNVNSKQVVEVKEGGPNKFDFNIPKRKA
jgi:hypothetical protein